MDQPTEPKASILFFDDDPALRKLLSNMLTKAGYEMRVAENGREGLEMFEERPADLVITDLVMPEQEGLESIMQLRRKYPNLKIIAVSGGLQGGMIDMLPAAEKLGAVRTLHKPLERSRLLETIEEVLAE